jgi:putative hydrolase of the HAD superfamily
MLTSLDAVVFDFDGVLNRNYGAEGFLWARNVEAEFGFTAESFENAFFTEAFMDVLVGKTDIHAVLDALLPALGCRRPSAEFLAFWFEQDLTPCAAAFALVAEVRAAGLRCVIGTNNEPRRAAFLWERALKGRVDGFYTAGLMGVAKPDTAFFRHIQDDLGVANPARLLLIDDIPANVAGAKAAGWQALQYGDFPARTLGDPHELRVALGL